MFNIACCFAVLENQLRMADSIVCSLTFDKGNKYECSSRLNTVLELASMSTSMRKRVYGKKDPLQSSIGAKTRSCVLHFKP